MTDDDRRKTPELPANVDEFNKAAGLILLQLYASFPEPINIDHAAIARAFGVDDVSWNAHMLPSGRSLSALLSLTIGWLKMEGYTNAFGPHPAQSALLTEKGLRALNAIPPGLNGTVGTQLKKAVERGSWPDLSSIGDLVGGMIGGLTKSMSS
jgi:hypothetical protein